MIHNYIYKMSSEQFSKLTVEITRSLKKEEKKNYGIFITPRTIYCSLYSSVNAFLNGDFSGIRRILEPSCGTCEIVNYCDDMMRSVEIVGLELNPTVYASIQSLTFKNTVRLYNTDFLHYFPEKEYDFIIGNPPYVVCNKAAVPVDYHEYIVGRPNLFGLFIVHSLQMLRTGGILAFVVPNSFLNSLYYSKIRNYIKQTCSLIKIEDYSSQNEFMDTQQSTFGLILQKKVVVETPCKYSMRFNGNYIFTPDSDDLRELFSGSTTLKELGLAVRTGKIVWNEVKSELTDDETATLLIYNTNVSKDNTIEVKQFKNDEKKQYIQREGRVDPVLVVNRGNGNSCYKLNYAIVREGPFLVENHLNEIYSPTKMEGGLQMYEKIIESFQHPKTKRFIELFLGNNSLSKTELETIFPIYGFL